MIYNELTRQHFETAVHAGVLTGPNTQRGAAGSRAQGTWVQFDVQWTAQNGRVNALGHAEVEPRRVVAARFQAFGCPHVIAVSDWVAQRAVGLPAAPRLPESVSALKRRFDVPTEKLGRLLVIEDAWIAALSPPRG